MNTGLSLFALTAFVTVALPGPTVMLALNNGIHGGFRAALPGIAGAMSSDLLLIGAVTSGLAGVLLASAAAFEVLRWLGVAYLAWLGLRHLRAGGSATPASTAGSDGAPGSGCPRPGDVFWRSLGVALSNPKAYLFFAALLPSFVDPMSSPWPQYLVLALLFTAIDGAVMLAYAAAGAAGRRGLSAGRRVWPDRAMGAALLLLAGGLALARRPASSGY